jgi:hypothetical protein
MVKKSLMVKSTVALQLRKMDKRRRQVPQDEASRN